MSTMSIMGREGDTKVSWNKDNPDEVAVARAMFDDAVKNKKMMAFRVDESGKSGEQIKTFDPHAERLLLSPALRGG